MLINDLNRINNNSIRIVLTLTNSIINLQNSNVSKDFFKDFSYQHTL